MRVLFLSEEKARLIDGVDNTHAIISICEPERNLELYNTNALKDKTSNPFPSWWDEDKSPPPAFSEWTHIHRSFFHDVDLQRYPDMNEDGVYTCFSKEQAEAIIDFIESLPPEVDKFCVHCAAGISRSAGVAKFLIDFYTDRGLHVRSNLTEEYQFYNRHVYRTLWDAWQERKSAQVSAAPADESNVT